MHALPAPAVCCLKGAVAAACLWKRKGIWMQLRHCPLADKRCMRIFYEHKLSSRLYGRLSIDAPDLRRFMGAPRATAYIAFYFLLGKSYGAISIFPCTGWGCTVLVFIRTYILRLSISILPRTYYIVRVYRVRLSLRSTQPIIGRDTRSLWGRRVARTAFARLVCIVPRHLEYST